MWPLNMTEYNVFKNLFEEKFIKFYDMWPLGPDI